MRKFLYFELFLIVILGFIISYKVAQRVAITQKIVYRSIKKIEIKTSTPEMSNSLSKKNNFKGVSGKIFKKYGYVFINNKKASLNDEIKTGDIVKTSSYSYTIIKFSNGSAIKINPNSKLKIDNLEKEKADSFKIHVITGSILSHFSKKGKYIINTRTATVGVRGTTFFTKVENEEQTTICACHGNIEFSDKNNHRKEIKSDHHQVFSLNSKGFVKNINPLIPEVQRLHRDSDISELKTIINSPDTITESKYDYNYSHNSKILKKAIDLIEKKKGKKAVVVLSKIAKKDAYASFLVGRILYEGIGIKKNKKTAIKWFKISAGKEFPDAVEYLNSL